jgi:hypothetical protein
MEAPTPAVPVAIIQQEFKRCGGKIAMQTLVQWDSLSKPHTWEDEQDLTGGFQLHQLGVKLFFEAGENVIVVWTSLGPLPRWVPGPITRWAPGTTRLVSHGTCWCEAQGLRWRSTWIGSYRYHVLCGGLLDVHD